MSCVHSYLIRTLQLSNESIIEGEIEITTKQPSDYKIGTQSFERKPTAGIQEIAEKPFTVIHIDRFTTKAGETMVIIDVEEKFENIEYKNEDDQKVRGVVSRFFASPYEAKKFFGDENVIRDVNDSGNKIRTSMEKVPFTSDEIKKKASLKGKTHYIFKSVEAKQGKIGV